MAAALAIKFACFESARIAPLYKISLMEIAELAGMSADTVSKHVSRLDAAGLLRRDSVLVPGGVDPETGEIVPPKQQTLLAPVGDAAAFAKAAAELDPGSGWGGLRTNGFGRSRSTGARGAEGHEILPFPPAVADLPAQPPGRAA